MPDAVKCNCRHPECTTCNPPDPDPTAAELARCVAWLRARATMFDKLADDAYYSAATMTVYQSKADLLRQAADDLERGEQP